MTKSSEHRPDIFMGHSSKLYKSTGKRLYLTICNKTSSILFILPKTVFAAQ